MKSVFINGKFVPAARAAVSVFDRSFQLGDGLFETIPVFGGRPFQWTAHLARLRWGARILSVRFAYSNRELADIAQELLCRHSVEDVLLRLHLSRGVGRRGYSPRGADSPTFVMTLHEALFPDPASPPHWRLGTSSFRIPAGDPLSLVKTASKVLHVMARSEVERRGCDEALLSNTYGHLVEGAGSNIFWVEGQTVCTPPLGAGALDGTTRAFVLKLAQRLRLPVAESNVPASHLATADGVFSTLSSLGLVPAVSLDGVNLRLSPVVSRLIEAYWREVRRAKGK